MARNRKFGQGVNVEVSGMTLQSIIDIDPTHIKNLSRKSLAELTSRLVSASNKRLRRLEKRGIEIYSPAYKARVKEGSEKAERFSVKGKSYNALQREFAKAKQFLTEKKTSTIAGTLRAQREMEERIGHHFETKEEANAFWDNVKKLEEAGVLNEGYTSAQLQRDVASMMEEGIDFDEMLERANERAGEFYEPETEEDPFELEEDDYEEDDYEEEDYEEDNALVNNDKKQSSRIRVKFEKIKIF